VRISMGYLRHLSIQRTRRETLAEHSRFLRRLDHELKNPLTTLRTGLKTLALMELDGPQRQVVETMETETVRLSRLVMDLRKLADLEIQSLNLQPLDLHIFVANIMQAERERFEAGRRTLACYVQGTHKTWVADEDLLALAVHNLLDNAFKYSGPGDAVHLGVSAEHELTIQVSDEGIGIAQCALAHIWEDLYRAEHVEKIPGSGIGLALVKAIVERHGGTVDVASKPGLGTTVSLHLPPLSVVSRQE
jgi:two-component system, OmpR family, sensor kinase